MRELYQFNDNGQYYTFTPDVVSETFEGLEYLPAIVVRGKVQQTDNFTKSPISFRFDKGNPFAKMVLNTLPEVPITAKIYRNHLPYWQGRVINAKSNGNYIEVACESIFIALLKAGTKYKIIPHCNHMLYSTACGVLQETWKINYAGITASGDTLTIPALSQPTGYFSNGKIHLAGQVRHIVRHDGTTLYLSNPFTGIITGTVDLYPGCKLTEENCIAFNNLPNHLGFSHIPSKNPFSSTGLL